MSEGHIRFEMARSGLEENCVRSTECAQCHIQVWLVSHTQFTTNNFTKVVTHKHCGFTTGTTW